MSRPFNYPWQTRPEAKAADPGTDTMTTDDVVAIDQLLEVVQECDRIKRMGYAAGHVNLPAIQKLRDDAARLLRKAGALSFDERWGTPDSPTWQTERSAWPSVKAFRDLMARDFDIDVVELRA